jgi:Co/Zn/Cd efflux system component
MNKKTRDATLTLIADLLTASTGAYLTAFAIALAQKEWTTVVISFLLALFTGCATIYFRQL